MPNFLKLSINELSVTLVRFTQYERLTAEIGDTEYSIIGTPIDSGPAYEPKFIWSCGAFLTLDEWRTLQAIFRLSDNKRRLNQNYRILVEDTVAEITDVGTRSRGIVPGGFITSIPGGVISYPAKFYARLFEPKFQRNDNNRYPYNASFTLKELDKVAP